MLILFVNKTRLVKNSHTVDKNSSIMVSDICLRFHTHPATYGVDMLVPEYIAYAVGDFLSFASFDEIVEYTYLPIPLISGLKNKSALSPNELKIDGVLAVG